MPPKLPNEPWVEGTGVEGLFAHAPEFHVLAAMAFMDGAASFVLLAFPSPSSDINPDALAQISFVGAFPDVLLMLLLEFYRREGHSDK